MRGVKTGGRAVDERLLETVEAFIKKHQRTNGRSPTLRQIMHEFPREFPALSKVQRYVLILKREGRIEDDNGKIGIEWQIQKNNDTIMIPQIGTVTCGEPILAVEEYESNNEIPASWFGRGELFILRAKGDSMINARIFDGDIVFIQEQPDVENGEIAAVIIEDEATLKRVYKYGNSIELRAENPIYKPINYNGFELERIKILGKAVAFQSNII